MMIKKLMISVVAVTFYLIGAVAVHCFAATPYTYCFIGDSRFVGMQQMIDTDEDIIWIAKVGARNDWYWDNWYQIADLPRDTVIIYELGVNDLNATACIEALQDLDLLGFHHIYFTTVTPVDEYKETLYGYKTQNSWIEEYNGLVRASLPPNVVSMDSYEYLTAMGVDTEDGLHYTGYTYQLWFNNIMNSL